MKSTYHEKAHYLSHIIYSPRFLRIYQNLGQSRDQVPMNFYYSVSEESKKILLTVENQRLRRREIH